jgi:hypothetical protein
MQLANLNATLTPFGGEPEAVRFGDDDPHPAISNRTAQPRATPRPLAGRERAGAVGTGQFYREDGDSTVTDLKL